MRLVIKTIDDDIIESVTAFTREAVGGWGERGYTAEIAAQAYKRGIEKGQELARKDYSKELPRFQ